MRPTAPLASCVRRRCSGRFLRRARWLDCSTLEPLHFLRRGALLPLLCLVSACADGGDDDQPQSDVKIAASHHLFGFRTLPGFGQFPVVPTDVVVDRYRLTLFNDSTYELVEPDGTRGSDRYAVATDGALSILLTNSSGTGGTVFRGGYGLVVSHSDLFFTDRIGTSSSPSIGLFYGTEVLPEDVVVDEAVEGEWHLLSLHTMFANSAADPVADNMAQGAHGQVTIGDITGAGIRPINGTGRQRTTPLTFTGGIQSISGTGIAHGACNLTLGYGYDGGSTDTRSLFAAAGRTTIVALDSDRTDGEAGMVAMVRQHDTIATPADITSLAGTYLVGGHTVFVNRLNAGSDTFVGVLTLTAAGALRLDGADHLGNDFSYSGSFTLNPNGLLTISIPGTSETWRGAVDRAYQTVVIVDDAVETRSNGIPELSLMFGVRKKA
jgi:hypothetical protein